MHHNNSNNHEQYSIREDCSHRGRYKLTYLGRVGKTSMSLKFVEDKFDENQKTTVNASYLDKTVTLSNNKDVKLAIWVRREIMKDTAGQ